MNFLDPALDAYASEHSSEEPAHLCELANETLRGTERPIMLSGHLQGRFLAMISRMVAPRTVVDIGTFTGYSALCLAEGLAEGGIVHTLDVSDAYGAMADRAIKAGGMSGKIERHIGHAADLIPTLHPPFDLVFIDADKSNYTRYWELVIERMRPGGVIIADNVLWDGRVVAPERSWDDDTRGLVAFARTVRGDARVEHVLVPLRDGLMVARKKQRPSNLPA